MVTEFTHTTTKPVEVSVVDVLREHLAFAKEQLNSKQTFLEAELEHTKKACLSQYALCGKLKKALAELVSEVVKHDIYDDVGEFLDLIGA